MVPAAVQRNWALLQLGRNREAEQALAQTPASALIPELILQRAILAVNRKDMRAAAVDLEEVLRQRPEDVRALRLLADIHVGEGRHKQAADRVRAQAEAHPANASLWECLGRILLAAGDTAGAARSFDTALRHDSGRWRLQLELVRLDISGGRFDSARQRLAGLTPAVKEHPATLVIQGVVEEQSGNPAAAIACYRKVLQLEPRNEIALNNLAWRLAEQDSTLDEGLYLAQRAREVSGAPAVDHTLGWICYRKGLYRTAIDHLSAAAAKQPTGRRKYDLACAYLKAGKTGLAQQTYAAARAMDPRLPELPPTVPLQHAPLPPP
jgi:tetratricopeptide (TPR) repeat protein